MKSLNKSFANATFVAILHLLQVENSTAIDTQFIDLGAHSEPAGSDPNCANLATSVGTVITYYDEDTEKVNMVATLKDGAYASWGWGASMTNTEMVIFSADGTSSGVKTYYGVGDYDPEEDFSYVACYSTSYVDNGDETITITTTRPLECTGL